MPWTSGLRRWAGRARRRHWPRRFVLLYHRVAEPQLDPWNLAVSPARFDEQLQVLRAHGPILTMERMVRGLDAGTLPARAVAVTFDDGYADTLLAAAPLLRRHDVPATVYLSTGLLDGRTSFWWDALARLILGQHPLPPRLEIRLGDRSVAWRAAQEDASPSEASRRDLHMELWASLRDLPHEMRRDVLTELAAWAEVERLDDPAERPMTRDEAARLAADPLIEIGAHTLTHPSLPAWPGERQQAEIEGSKAACEDIAGAPVRGFSYPYGAHAPETRRLVREAGFASACTTAAGPLKGSADRFLIPRVPALDWDGAELEECLASADFA